MIFNRVIVSLLIDNKDLVKGQKYQDHVYVGDPINAIRIFNNKEVDEISILDKSAYKDKINYNLIKKILNEAFIPISYGGGIKKSEQALRIIELGCEKIILNTSAYKNHLLISEIIKVLGSQSLTVKIDCKYVDDDYYVFIENGTKFTKTLVKDYSILMQELGVGELIISSIDKEGSRSGYDLELVKTISEKINIPIIIDGGAGGIDDFKKIFSKNFFLACSAGTIFTFYKNNKSVLLNYLNKKERESLF
tara:strand:- start:284 stop:1033 length:750 start_codon:yes stop_codon:yes gene_type:complete